MKRLLIASALFGLVATPAHAADCPAWDKDCIARQGPPQTDWAPPGCGYGSDNDPKCKRNSDGSWPGQPSGGWPGQPPPQGGWQQPPPNQGTGTWQPPPGQQQPPPGTGTWTPPPGQQQPPPTTTTTKRRCPPGQIALLYGNRWTCVRRSDQATGQCQPGWVYSRRLYKCVPGFSGGTDEQRLRVCGYGKVWNDYFQKCIPYRVGGGEGTPGGQGCKRWEVWSHSQYKCVPRRGGGTDGQQQGSYNCGPYERWSNSRQTCVPRRGGGGDTYGSGPSGGTYGSGGPGINIYINKGKRRGGDDYGRGGGDDYGRRGGDNRRGGNRQQPY
jgi:hypothetical protein